MSVQMASFTVLEFQNLLKIGPEFTCVKSKLLLFGTLVVSFIIFILQKKKKSGKYKQTRKSVYLTLTNFVSCHYQEKHFRF